MPTNREWAEALETATDIWKRRVKWYDEGGEWPDDADDFCGVDCCENCPLLSCEWSWREAWFLTAYSGDGVQYPVAERFAAQQLAEQLERLAKEYRSKDKEALHQGETNMLYNERKSSL